MRPAHRASAEVACGGVRTAGVGSRRLVSLLAALALATGPTVAGAQTPEIVRPVSTKRVTAGAAFGLLGAVAIGGTAGYLALGELDDDGTAAAGAFIGSTLFSTVLTPLGAHIANGGRGSYAAAALATAGTTALLLLGETRSATIVLPIGHILTAAWMERRTTR